MAASKNTTLFQHTYAILRASLFNGSYTATAVLSTEVPNAKNPPEISSLKAISGVF